MILMQETGETDDLPVWKRFFQIQRSAGLGWYTESVCNVQPQPRRMETLRLMPPILFRRRCWLSRVKQELFKQNDRSSMSSLLSDQGRLY